MPAVLDSASACGSANVQIALLIAGVACARALTEDQGLTPRFVAGHSVGAFAAAVTAGVIDFADALTAVELRGRLMKEACSQGDWGMAALTGLPIRTARQLAEETTTDEQPVWLANVNSATQTVLSGHLAGLQRAGDAARTAGAADYERLDVAVARTVPCRRIRRAGSQRTSPACPGTPRRRAT
jgi:malonate decarboxylase epsilon subunit